WRISFFWWLKSFVAPVVLVLELLKRLSPEADAEGRPPLEPDAWARAPEPAPVRAATGHNGPRRLGELERRVAALEQELADLRRAFLAAPRTQTAPQKPKPTPEP